MICCGLVLAMFSDLIYEFGSDTLLTLQMITTVATSQILNRFLLHLKDQLVTFPKRLSVHFFACMFVHFFIIDNHTKIKFCELILVTLFM
jgi:hypothetical protein